MQIAYSNEAFELWLLLHLTNVEKSKPFLVKELRDGIKFYNN
ncbi:MAG: hypothetical protein DRQ49_14610 [Gammaproteobacteria bacterium]|nr:MAG: hypothetical protein DRQ49_14610 [Gammaproteobacteria bacterium]RKZ75962.1 MAG: hypothetical protein DRQ57_05580 [Gammaproteobacteria bacterium]